MARIRAEFIYSVNELVVERDLLGDSIMVERGGYEVEVCFPVEEARDPDLGEARFDQFTGYVDLPLLSGAQEKAGVFETEDRGDDDAPLVMLANHRPQLILRLGRIDRQSCRAELARCLLIKIKPIESNDDRRRVVLTQELHGRKRHQKRLARALVMPDEPLVSVRIERTVDDCLDGFDLWISRDYLDGASGTAL
jgi:hypothetical protein